jgi:hypothetical protein
MEIWLKQEGKEAGPFTLEQVQLFLGEGSVQFGDDAWIDGWKDYRVIADIPFVLDIGTQGTQERLLQSMVHQSHLIENRLKSLDTQISTLKDTLHDATLKQTRVLDNLFQLSFWCWVGIPILSVGIWFLVMLFAQLESG